MKKKMWNKHWKETYRKEKLPLCVVGWRNRRFSKLTVTLEKGQRWFSGFSEDTKADLVGSVMLGRGCENPRRRWGWKWKRQLRLSEREDWGVIHLILAIRFLKERESGSGRGINLKEDEKSNKWQALKTFQGKTVFFIFVGGVNLGGFVGQMSIIFVSPMPSRIFHENVFLE